MSTEEVKVPESNNEVNDETEELDRSSKEEGEKEKDGHSSSNDDKKSKKKLALRFGKKNNKKAEIERLKKLGLQQQYIKGELQPANSIIQPNSSNPLARSSSDIKEDPIITAKDDSHIVDKKKGLSFLEDDEPLTDRRIRRSKSIGEKDFKELKNAEKKDEERIKVAPLSPEINAQISAPSRPPRPARGPATIKEAPKETPKEVQKEPPKEIQREPSKEKILNRRSSINLHPETILSEIEKEEKKEAAKENPVSPKQERKNTINTKTPVKQTEAKTAPTKAATKAAEKPEETKEKAKTVDFILPEKETPSSKAAKTVPAKDNVSKIMNAFNKSEEPAKPTPTKQTEKKPPGKLSDDRAKIFSKPEPEEVPVKKTNAAPKTATPASSKPSSAIKEDLNRSLSPSKGRPTKESTPATKEATKSPPPRRPEPSQDARSPTPNSAPNTPKIPPKPNKTSFIKDESKIPEKTGSSDSQGTSGEAERRQRGAPSKTATLPQNGREATSPPPTANAQNRSKTAPVRQGPPVPSFTGSLREKRAHGDATKPIQVDIGKVPLIVTGTVQYLDNQALDLEGLYRESANATQLKALRQAWETRQQIDLSSTKDPHTVAGLLKLYFREMYSPIPRSLNRKFMDALDAETSATKIKILRSAINSLADEDKNCLTYLFAHLKRVCDKSGINKMSAGNLGVCWAPTLFGNSQMIEVVQNLITNYEGIFVEEL